MTFLFILGAAARELSARDPHCLAVLPASLAAVLLEVRRRVRGLGEDGPRSSARRRRVHGDTPETDNEPHCNVGRMGKRATCAPTGRRASSAPGDRG